MSDIVEARERLRRVARELWRNRQFNMCREIEAIIEENMHRRPKPRERKTPVKKTKSVTATK